MENIKISQVCGLCAGCKHAIATTLQEIASGKNVSIFKEIVHNKNVNNFLLSKGAKIENDINKLSNNDFVIIRAHGEPPETYSILKNKGISYIDCTCHNVTAIHNLVKEYSGKGYKIIILGKHRHPEVLGTKGWSSTEVILIEREDDISKLSPYHNEKFYLVCQTTFNLKLAELLITKIEKILEANNNEIIINKSLCGAQKVINEFSVKLAYDSDIMIVVGGFNSSNSLELYKNISNICPSIFIEDISAYKEALNSKGLVITADTKVGITAGASTLKEELIKLKELIINDLK